MSWIKIRTNLATDPSVAAIGMKTGKRSQEVVYALYALASWFQENGEYGKIKATPEVLNSVVGFAIFDALTHVGFVRFYQGTIVLCKFTSVSIQRKGIGTKLRAEVLASGCCANCGGGGPFEVDHIIPIYRGGSCERSNLQALCVTCNRKKGAK